MLLQVKVVLDEIVPRSSAWPVPSEINVHPVTDARLETANATVASALSNVQLVIVAAPCVTNPQRRKVQPVIVCVADEWKVNVPISTNVQLENDRLVTWSTTTRSPADTGADPVIDV